MEISIIIVNYNTEKLTLGCIDSLKKNPPGVPYEIIVIDNGSTKRLKNDGLGFKLISNETNLGFAKANNQGIKVAKGKYILLLNSDTEVKKDSIDKLYEFARTSPDAGAVVPKLLNPDGSIQPSVFRFPTILLAARQYWFGEKGLLDKYIPPTHQKLKTSVESAVMAVFLITPQTRKEVGLLNEKYFMYFEDLDYCRRIREAGLKIFYFPDSEVIHFHGASGKNLVDKQNQWRRLIPSSIIYHGWLGHQIINLIIWSGQKLFGNEKN